MAKRKNIDCPFTQEEIAIFHDMLYQVNAGNKCINPMHFCWVKGVMVAQEIEQKEEKNNLDYDLLNNMFD
jgi:hypothetical protein